MSALDAGARLVIMAAAVGFYAYYGLYKMLFVHFELVGGDFLRGCFAASNFLAGRTLYQMPEKVNPFYYPPLAVLLYLPLCALGRNVAKAAWFSLTHAMILAAALVTYRLLCGASRRDALLATCAAFGFSMPLQGLILTGNANVVIWLGLTFVCSAIVSGRLGVAPGVLAACTWIKLYPAALVLPLAWRGDWRAVGRYAVIVLALGVTSLAVFGLGDHLVFLRQLPGLDRYVGVFSAASFAFVLKLSAGEHSSSWIQVLNLLFALAVVGLCWAHSVRASWGETDRGSLALDMMLIMVAIILATPASWLFYHAFLVLPQALVLFLWLRGRRLRWAALFGVLSVLIDGWEVVVYQLPLAPGGLTIREVGERRAEFEALYPMLYAIPFALTAGAFAWLLLNYGELRRGLAGLARTTGAPAA
jgi:hypothetical protein